MTTRKKALAITITIVLLIGLSIMTYISIYPNKNKTNYYIKYYVEEREYAGETYSMYYVIPEPKEYFIIDEQLNSSKKLDKIYIKRYYLDRDMAIVSKNIDIYEIMVDGVKEEVVKVSDLKHRKIKFKNSIKKAKD